MCAVAVLGYRLGRRSLFTEIAWINTVVDTVKGSALLSLVGIVDLMLSVQQVIGRTFEPMPLYILGALMYFAINYALSLASRRLEAHYAYVRE